MARKTSIDCYYEKVNTIKAPLYKKIFATFTKYDIKAEGLTRGEIATYSKIEKSTISARVKELLESGHLYEEGKRRDAFSNITCNVLKINKEKQYNIF